MVAVYEYTGVEMFIMALELPYEVAKGILLTEDECADYRENYHGKNINKIDDLLDFKDDRLDEQQDITYEQFLAECRKMSVLYTFTYTFRQRFTLSDIALIKQKIADNEITLKKILYSFKKNPHKNIMHYVL